MRLISKPRPVLASFAAAAVALLPALAMAISEIMATQSGVVDPSQTDDPGYRGAGLALAAAPFFYIAAVPICHVVGSLLVSLGLRRLGRFLAGTVAVALLLGLLAGGVLSAPSRFGVGDVVLSVAVFSMLFLVSALPAALCWWFFAVRPHNLTLHNSTMNRDAKARPLSRRYTDER